MKTKQNFPTLKTDIFLIFLFPNFIITCDMNLKKKINYLLINLTFRIALNEMIFKR